MHLSVSLNPICRGQEASKAFTVRGESKETFEMLLHLFTNKHLFHTGLFPVATLPGLSSYDDSPVATLQIWGSESFVNPENLGRARTPRVGTPAGHNKC